MSGPPPPLPPLPQPDAPPEEGSDPFGSHSVALYFRDTLSVDSLDLSAEATAAAPPPVMEKTEGSRYTSVSELGRGGFATVYLVNDANLKRTVALKLLRLAGKGRPRVERFLAEARGTAALEHPNIVPIYDIGTLGGLPFYTMKYVRGRPLSTVLTALRAGDTETVRTYSLTRLVQILLQVAMAAHYAHGRGVVHLDLKPANVMLGEFGEVVVMDWGLARAMAAAQERRGLLGTPVYMAPEQATGHLEEVDARTDVYALGLMLYEMLTLRRPFEGRDLQRLLREIAVMPPPLPSAVCGSRHVPAVLAAVSLRALAKVKEIRQSTARVFHDDLQGWLEAEADKRRRSELAFERVSEARSRLERYRALRAERDRLGQRTAELRAASRPAQPLDDKKELLVAEEGLRAVRRELVRASSGVVTGLTEALGFEPENPAARHMLAEYYWTRLTEAEEEGNADTRDFFAELVARYDDGSYAGPLLGEGRLAVTSDPPGLEAVLMRYEEDGFVLRPGEGRSLGRTPIAEQPLAMGSYLVLLRGSGGGAGAGVGGRELRYPIDLRRGASWSGQVTLHAGVPPGFVAVAAGPFRAGPPPGARCAVGDFAIAIHPITLGDYLSFLADLARRDLEAARRHAPRAAPGEPSFVTVTEGGATVLASRSPYGVPWASDWPVTGVSWHDAQAYAAWRSARGGVHLALPTSLEWEKAARGTDGRRYPWGDRFDPGLANMKRSLEPPPRPVAVTAFPFDESPYGVRGMGGNVRDWCADQAAEGDETRDERVVRGGAWSLGASCVDAWAAGGLAAAATSPHVGFRLVWRP